MTLNILIFFMQNTYIFFSILSICRDKFRQKCFALSLFLNKSTCLHTQFTLFIKQGPELLNKYIGASEQAVRDTFLR